MLTAGAMVGGYRIERELGAGGMGSVYLASHPTLPRYDALKVLSRELSRDPDFRTRFIREADVAASLDHPQIVAVYNRGETDDGQLWIAMQFVDGTDADAALREGTMTPARAVHIVTEVAKALDFAHSRNVVHRDVKPANFLLSGPAGPDERVLLGDFGIARALDDVGLTATGVGDGHHRLRRTRGVVGHAVRRPCRHLFTGLHPVSAADRQDPVLRHQWAGRDDDGPPAAPAAAGHRRWCRRCRPRSTR